jgi:hypothetical protein
MAIATCSTAASDFNAVLGGDPLELMALLADGLDLLEQCKTRAVAPTDEFLEYLDCLLVQAEMLEAFGKFYAA